MVRRFPWPPAQLRAPQGQEVRGDNLIVHRRRWALSKPRYDQLPQLHFPGVGIEPQQIRVFVWINPIVYRPPRVRFSQCIPDYP